MDEDIPDDEVTLDHLDDDGTFLIHRTLYLTDYVARRYTFSFLEYEDARSLAALGLTLAAQRWKGYCSENNYDPTRMNWWRTFAMQRMRGAILDHCRSQDNISRNSRDMATAIERHSHDNPSDEELAKRLDTDVATIRRVKAEYATAFPTSLSNDISDNEIDSLDLPSGDLLTEDHHTMGELLEQFSAYVETLDPTEQKILELHYFKGDELGAVAEQVDLTLPRVSKLHTEAVLKILAWFQTHLRNTKRIH